VSVAEGEGRPARTVTFPRSEPWLRTLVRFWSLFRPPVRDPKFWATQALVVLIAGGHDFLEVSGLLSGLGMAYLLPISLFFVPVIYAALFFGLSGSLATALWCNLLTVPNWVLWHTGTARVGSISQMLIIDIIAIFVGSRVDERMKASQALQVSETKYRGLFDTAGEGILVLDHSQRIVECNASAAALLRESPDNLYGMRLDEVVDRRAASALVAAASGADARFRGGIPLKGSGGEQVWVEPVCTPLAGQEGLTQVVLRNVTEQKRRQAELANYSAQVVGAQEEERRRLAQELHDETVQSLLLLCRMLDDSDVNRPADPVVLAQVLREAHSYTESLVQSVRALAWGLRPALLDDLGLVSALDQSLAELTSRCSIQGKLVLRGRERRLAAEVELALFRIAQEALHNVERHSGASCVQVGLRYGQSEARLVIIDDGVGFSPPEALGALANEKKLGLIGMQERARIVGGKVTIRSAPGRGTSVTVTIPSDN
jgi:PAS domain S-box-containing protein